MGIVYVYGGGEGSGLCSDTDTATPLSVPLDGSRELIRDKVGFSRASLFVRKVSLDFLPQRFNRILNRSLSISLLSSLLP